MFYHVLSILDSEICRYRNIRNVKSNRCTTKHCVELGSTHSQGHDELYWPAELLSTQATQLEIELNSLEKLTGSCCPSQESSWRLWRPRRSRKHGLQTKCSHFYIFQIWILLLTVRPSISLWPIIYRMPDAKIQVYNVVLLLYIYIYIMSSTVIQGASFSSNAWKSTVSYKNIRYKETFDFAGLSKCLPYLSCPPLSPCYNIVHESRHAALDTRFPNLNALHTGCPSWHHNHNHLRYSRLLGPKQNTKQRSRLQCVLQKWRWIFREYLSFSFFVFVDRFISAKLLSPRATSLYNCVCKSRQVKWVRFSICWQQHELVDVFPSFRCWLESIGPEEFCLSSQIPADPYYLSLHINFTV